MRVVGKQRIWLARSERSGGHTQQVVKVLRVRLMLAMAQLMCRNGVAYFACDATHDDRFSAPAQFLLRAQSEYDER